MNRVAAARRLPVAAVLIAALALQGCAGSAPSSSLTTAADDPCRNNREELKGSEAQLLGRVTYEGFSEDPQLVAELGAAAVRGLQGKGLGDPNGVLACAKHFAGDGGTTMGTGGFEKKLLDQGDTRVDGLVDRSIKWLL